MQLLEIEEKTEVPMKQAQASIEKVKHEHQPKEVRPEEDQHEEDQSMKDVEQMTELTL